MATTAHVEVTDTFSGEANYCWVRRYSFPVPPAMSDLAIMRREIPRGLRWRPGSVREPGRYPRIPPVSDLPSNVCNLRERLEGTQGAIRIREPDTYPRKLPEGIRAHPSAFQGAILP